MSACGYERVIRPLYTYRPASAQALGGLVAADMRQERTQIYFADLLRIVALANLKPEAELPTLAEFLTPPAAEESAETIYSRLIAKLRS